MMYRKPLFSVSCIFYLLSNEIVLSSTFPIKVGTELKVHGFGKKIPQKGTGQHIYDLRIQVAIALQPDN